MRRELVGKSLISILIVAIVIMIFYRFLDSPIAWLAHNLKDTFIHRLAVSLSYLADHTVVFSFAAVGFTICAVNLTGPDPRTWARKLLYVCLSACIAIAFVESVKFVFGRCRPEFLFSEGRYGFSWLTNTYELNSFPSGHTTRIFALAAAVTIMYRRSAIPVLTIAVLVGISRVIALKHYPSDVLAGALLGIIVACWTHVVWKKE